MAIQHAQPTKQTQPQRRLFTIEEYERMIDAGVFDEDERIELIRGEIVEMPPISDGHAGVVGELTMLLAPQAAGKAMVWVQNPIHLPNDTRPEPDLALLKPGRYDAKR